MNVIYSRVLDDSSTRHYVRLRSTVRLRTDSLALCLSLALLSQTSLASGVPAFTKPHAKQARVQVTTPKHVTQSWLVDNCDDSGTGSLRDVIQNQAQNGGIVDLSHLPTNCGMTDSKITLGSEIAVSQDDLALIGPADGTVTVSGGGTSRVFHHTGVGTLSLSALTISDGYYHVPVNAYGGCIESDFGNVNLDQVTISNCTVVSDNGFANGGAVCAYVGNITLVGSTISGNHANAPAKQGFGAGLYARGSVGTKYSTIRGNTALDSPGTFGQGGGLDAIGGATIVGSTIAENSGGYGGGLTAHGPTEIIDSTISGNISTAHNAVNLVDVDSAMFTNSTIAFNHEATSGSGGAVYFRGTTAVSELTLQSSILGNNTAGPMNMPADLYVNTGVLAATGLDNLVVASNVASPPPGVVTVMTDPMLGPLQFNGGPTPSRALLPGSPALGAGNNDAMLSYDQRGTGYPRTSGPNASVDMGALQFDTIFASGFDF